MPFLRPCWDSLNLLVWFLAPIFRVLVVLSYFHHQSCVSHNIAFSEVHVVRHYSNCRRNKETLLSNRTPTNRSPIHRILWNDNHTRSYYQSFCHCGCFAFVLSKVVSSYHAQTDCDFGKESIIACCCCCYYYCETTTSKE